MTGEAAFFGRRVSQPGYHENHPTRRSMSGTTPTQYCLADGGSLRLASSGETQGARLCYQRAQPGSREHGELSRGLGAR